jgi:hypothetical protein
MLEYLIAIVLEGKVVNWGLNHSGLEAKDWYKKPFDVVLPLLGRQKWQVCLSMQVGEGDDQMDKIYFSRKLQNQEEDV